MLRRAWLIPLILCLAESPDAFAATAHFQLEVGPDKVFQRLLEAAEAGEQHKAAKAVVMLNPILEEIDQVFGHHVGEDVMKALDDPALEQVVRRAIAYSVVLLLRYAQRSGQRDAMVPAIRLAFSEYLVLDPDAQRHDFELSKAMKLAFRRANAAAGQRPEEFLAASEEIERALLRAYDTVARDGRN